jgi:AP-2 complex subunit alpha
MYIVHTYVRASLKTFLPSFLPHSLPLLAVREKQGAIFECLGENDVSIRKRALDLLFEMCDRGNAKTIVAQLVSHLHNTDPSIQDEMVLKIAILSEKFAPDLRWYVDTMLHLIESAKENVSDDIWHRVVQIVTNHEDLQAYAVTKLWKTMQDSGAGLNTALIKTGGYLLGEFGFLIAETSGCSGSEQFALLKGYFDAQTCSTDTKGLLLSSFVKMVNLYPNIKDDIVPAFELYKNSWNGELQQRAVEYAALPSIGADLMYTVLDTMPVFPENKESPLEKRIKEKNAERAGDHDGAEDLDDEGAPGQNIDGQGGTLRFGGGMACTR